MDYKKNQTVEFLFLIKRGFSYSDILLMPIYLRKSFINFMLDLEK